jgi:putative ABC transport system permease protein
MNPGDSRSIVLLARLLLSLHPAVFRREWGGAYVEVAVHRYGVELKSGRGRVRAWLATAMLLCADAVGSVPRQWGRRLGVGSYAGGAGRAGSRRLPVRLDALLMTGRLAIRSLARRPGFSGLVVVTLGLGLGASASVFGALDRIVLRPLPYAVGDRLSYIALENQLRGWQFAPFQEVVDRWRQGSTTVEGLEVYRHLSGVVDAGSGADLARVVGVSGGLTGMLGIAPLAGRVVGPGDTRPGADPVLVVSERYWRGRWGSDPSVVGRPVRMNDTLFTVVGVWPESARLDYRGAPDFFRALPRDQESPPGDFALVLALLRPGIAIDVVEAELGSLAAGIDGVSAEMRPVVTPPWGFLRDDYVRGLWLVFCGGLVLMLVATLNAANLMLGRADSRSEEIGIRIALGATWSRLAGLFLMESAVLCGSGVVAGLIVAKAIDSLLKALEPGDMLPPGVSGPGTSALLFAVGLAAAALFACTLIPLVLAQRSAGGPVARDAGRRATGAPSRFRFGLVTAQAALAVVLVVGASLLARSLSLLTGVDSGMAIEQLAVASVRLPADRYPTPDAQIAFEELAVARLAALPGVRAVTTSSSPLLRFSVRGGLPILDGEPEPVDTEGAFTASNSIGPGYFDALGVDILEGRDFAGIEERAVIVNTAFARSRPGRVVGRSLRFPGDTASRTIVGVVGDVRSNGLSDAPNRPQLYYPGRPGGAYQRFIVRTAADPAGALVSIRQAFREIDPGLPIREATTGIRAIRDETARLRFLATLLGGFALLGLGFAVAGIHGAVSIEVGRRIRDVGIRMALGSTAGHVLITVVRRGLRPVALGAAIGSIAWLWTAPYLETVLFQTAPRDPLSIALALAILFFAATSGCLLPALRASRTDPATTLRAE